MRRAGCFRMLGIVVSVGDFELSPRYIGGLRIERAWETVAIVPHIRGTGLGHLDFA